MARARKPRLTKNQKQWFSEIERIEQIIIDTEHKGFQVDISLKKPKKITKKDLQRLSEITSESIEEISYTFSEETGAVVSMKYYKSLPVDMKYEYNAFREAVNSSYTYKEFSFNSDTIIENFMNKLKTIQNGGGYQIIENWLNSVIQICKQQDEETAIDRVAQMLKTAEEQGLVVTNQMAYDLELNAAYREAVVLFLPEAGQITIDMINDLAEYNESGNYFNPDDDIL